MNLVDSSGWLEYLADGENAKFFAPALEDVNNLIIPSICVYEVSKKIIQQKSEHEALQVAALMHQGRIIDLDLDLSISAARLSIAHKLPMADSIVLATSKSFQAVIWTQDVDFQGMKDVKFISKKNNEQEISNCALRKFFIE